jgi:hypothetical protein
MENKDKEMCSFDAISWFLFLLTYECWFQSTMEKCHSMSQQKLFSWEPPEGQDLRVKVKCIKNKVYKWIKQMGLYLNCLFSRDKGSGCGYEISIIISPLNEKYIYHLINSQSVHVDYLFWSFYEFV